MVPAARENSNKTVNNPSDDAGDYEKSWNNNQNVDTISVEFDEALEETTRRAHRHHQTQTTNNHK